MAGVESLVLHGAHGAGLDVSWPVVAGATVFWAVVGGGAYWYYTSRLDELE